MNQADFKELVWDNGRSLFRSMPWRGNTGPYWVLVSELMLQQTQADRVMPKFNEFVAVFPTIKDLAQAPLGEVLKQWSGLGYNRRAKFLHEAAKKVETDFEGSIPSTFEELVKLPGVGPNTAGAILAYSFNQPVVFIETNIRTVYFHHFFQDQARVSDKELKEIVAETLDTEHPRQWYWALMDYGAFLKKQGAGRIDQSSHYKKQAPLRGSLREMRGLILKTLAAGDQKPEELQALLPQDERYEKALAALMAENMIQASSDRLHLSR